MLTIALVLHAAFATSLAAPIDPSATSAATEPRDAAVEALLAEHAPGLESDSAPPARQESDAKDAEHLAKQLSNPIANLMSFPFQWNYDSDIGPGDKGERMQLNFQPVIPMTWNQDWNMISRTILPLIDQDDVVPGDDHQFGLGDVTQSLFFSPVKPTAQGLIWGAGPVFLIPTATDDKLGSEKWGIGPTAVALKQEGAWTFGALVNHIWSFAGDGNRSEISSTFLQPFISHTTPTAWTFSLNTESTYDWHNEDWAVPINVLASKLVKFGGTPISIGAGLRYWAESASGGPEGWGLRIVITPLLPKKG